MEDNWDELLWNPLASFEAVLLDILFLVRPNTVLELVTERRVSRTDGLIGQNDT